ncbi:polysaccharide pyruvyl transferase family protein [Desulfococcus multivorans]|uniref:Polysaccharide pyruvyl transferase n=1 Tax=Desulfococcus multivorans DSM 2059 TaxID=1121405 RepID=S7UP30_DESML|nr:polysaccharide pyruvyl transferase family protein [Desulfococcus multivorans]AOY60123.1 uncharacterized protein Dmul_33530 [Desulfococcus multivorans]AQV02258.1 hypothetical protein B2D07_16790 [Desulfococcus multivorans]EPR34088.1 polysaccharide pyruvyl transferase [Desulfococcus multivorans DSM 2059]SKA27358.1 Polysaccharide pyruvyl transferase [Desulfococcus multivorans DSM 2059]
MKIGILTYHRVVNDGSVVQAYCLEKLIRSYYPNATIELVDYRPWRGEKQEHLKILTKRYPFVRYSYWNKLRSIRVFIKNNFQGKSPSCITDNIEKARRFIDAQSYDAVIVGSDTVWEGRPSGFAPHSPNIYFLPDLPSIKKIAFASSADPIISSYANNVNRAEKIRAAIEAFNFISVRDDSTRDYLVNLGISSERIHFMPDPTLLWDLNSIVDHSIAKYSNNKPLAGIAIGIGNTSVKGQMTEQLIQNGFDVIDLERPKQIEKYFSQPQSLNQRLGLYSNLNMIVTDRFHGSIFTLLLAGAPVLFVETSSKWPDRNSKGRDLFRRLGLEEMVWRYDVNAPESGLVRNRLNRWNDLSKQIQGRIQSLRYSAKNTLEKMFQCLE